MLLAILYGICFWTGVTLYSLIILYLLAATVTGFHISLCECISELRQFFHFGGKFLDIKWYKLIPIIIYDGFTSHWATFYPDITQTTRYEDCSVIYYYPRHPFSFGKLTYNYYKKDTK